ncbi:NPGR2-like protein [Drosera capensis]
MGATGFGGDLGGYVLIANTMNNEHQIKQRRKRLVQHKFPSLMKCLCSGELVRMNEIDSLTKSNGEVRQNPDIGNIEEAESSLRESASLNYEGARALLGRYEYQKGNVEAALHVFEGIDIGAVTPKIKLSLSRTGHRSSFQSDDNQSMSVQGASLLLEAIFLKAKSLQALGRFNEAAQSCKIILDLVASSCPDGLPETSGADCKLQETLSKAVELLPQLWILADCPQEAIMAYRRALLSYWKLDTETIANIQKEFAVHLLYSGGEAAPPDLRSQLDTSFTPTNNLEEAILLLMILLRKVHLKMIKWDPSILDHLSFAISVSGQTQALASAMEEMLPGIIDRKERYLALSLCYYGDGDSSAALNLLRHLLSARSDPNNVPALLMASKLCGENPETAEEGIRYAQRALGNLDDGCYEMIGVAEYLLGVSLSQHAKLALADSDRVSRQTEAIHALERAAQLTKSRDPSIIYRLSLEHAEQRKLDVALRYAKLSLKLEGGSDLKGWILMARILSAQKRFPDAEVVVNAAIDQTGKWSQGELLRTKAKIEIAHGHLKNAVETYAQLLAIFQVQSKSVKPERKLMGSGIQNHDRHLELETWHDLARMYISFSKWPDVELCLSKSASIERHSASRWHVVGSLNEAKGYYKEALAAYTAALDIDPTHVPSMISSAVVLRHLSRPSNPVIRSFLMDALQLDRMNHTAWYNLGLFHRAKGTAAAQEAAECFQAAAFLEETAPVEPFR